MERADPDDRLDPGYYGPVSAAAPAGASLGPGQIAEFDVDLPFPVRQEKDPPSYLQQLKSSAALPLLDRRREVLLGHLERTRDLRVLVRLAETLSLLDGPRGLHAALHLLTALVNDLWDDIHPGPAADPGSVLLRRNALTPLRGPNPLARLETTVLFNAGGFEREITLRHAWHAAGLHETTRRLRPEPGETVYDSAALAALVARAEAGDSIRSMHRALTESAALLQALQAFLSGQAGYEVVSFSKPLIEPLGLWATALAPLVPAPESAGSPAAVPIADGPQAVAADPQQTAVVPAPAAAPGTPSSRDEARALFDAVLGFYAEHGRSSPIALALLRVRALEEATFAQWLEVLDPEDAESVALPLAGTDPAALDAYRSATVPVPAGVGDRLAALEAAVAGLEADGTAPAAALSAVRAAATDLRETLLASPSAADRPVIADRAAVRQALQRLVHYYRAAEPSSPVSLCLERLIDLVDRSFMDILKKIAPRGLRSAALKLAP